MDLVVQGVTAAFLIAMTISVVIAIVTNLRHAALARQSAEVESEKLQAQIDRIMDARRFEREKNELSWNGVRKFEVAKKFYEGGDICSFYFKPHDRKPLPPFHPGQYLTFNLNIPGQKKTTIRCYSLSDAPNPEYYRCSIKRVPAPRDKDVPPGLSSNFFHDQVNEGDIIDCKAPNGHFYLDLQQSGPVVLIGGGVGLTPVVSMLNALTNMNSKREIWFFLGFVNSTQQVMHDHFTRIGQEFPDIKMFFCYSNPTPECPPPGPHLGGTCVHARVSVDLFKKLLPSNNYDYYFCGPPPMMSSLFEDLTAWGVPEPKIHYEAFGPATVKKVAAAEAKTDAAPAAEAAGGFKVTFAKSSKTVTWSSGSLLELAEANDVDLPFGCRAGNCGSCLTAIKAGDVKYLQTPGAAIETGSCLACVSVPKVDLTLDA